MSEDEPTIGEVVEYVASQAPSWVSVGGFWMRYEGAFQLLPGGKWEEIE